MLLKVNVKMVKIYMKKSENEKNKSKRRKI